MSNKDKWKQFNDWFKDYEYHDPYCMSDWMFTNGYERALKDIQEKLDELEKDKLCSPQ